MLWWWWWWWWYDGDQLKSESWFMNTTKWCYCNHWCTVWGLGFGPLKHCCICLIKSTTLGRCIWDTLLLIFFSDHTGVLECDGISQKCRKNLDAVPPAAKDLWCRGAHDDNAGGAAWQTCCFRDTIWVILIAEVLNRCLEFDSKQIIHMIDPSVQIRITQHWFVYPLINLSFQRTKLVSMLP